MAFAVHPEGMGVPCCPLPIPPPEATPIQCLYSLWARGLRCSMAGRSRSPAIVLAYLMSTNHMPYDESLRVVKTARRVVNLNDGAQRHGARLCGRLDWD